MKKRIVLFAMLLVSAFCFADKWKASDFYFPARVEKTIEKYKLTKTYTAENIEFYKNEETNDWLYIYKNGTEDELSEVVVMVAFANLGGVFDSCSKYGQLVDKQASRYKYLMSVITEENYLVPEADHQPGSNYVWRTPQNIYVRQFYNRMIAYINMYNAREQLGIQLPEKVVARYDYFINYWNANSKNETFVNDIGKEYKKYWKEHK